MPSIILQQWLEIWVDPFKTNIPLTQRPVNQFASHID